MISWMTLLNSAIQFLLKGINTNINLQLSIVIIVLNLQSFQKSHSLVTVLKLVGKRVVNIEEIIYKSLYKTRSFGIMQIYTKFGEVMCHVGYLMRLFIGEKKILTSKESVKYAAKSG